MKRPRLEDEDGDWIEFDEYMPPHELSSEPDDDEGGVTVVGPEGPEE